MPVIKADKNRWRLVHDLRAINDVIEDLPAEVPNPHMLLTNVPPEAKYFTVIDLCSAYFSVPLAEESRYLFALHMLVNSMLTPQFHKGLNIRHIYLIKFLRSSKSAL